jgi:pyruvate dehydrogenase E2 component (dihydrolipoamide acetyltransferase)
MPRLGDTMTEGKVLQWLKKEGDKVEKGDPVVLISAEKVDYEVESPEPGLLKQILVKEEDVVAVGSVIGVIAAPGEEGSLMGAPKRQPSPGEREKISPPAELVSEDESSGRQKGVQKILISPAAKKLSQLLKVDYVRVTGTGPGGRIIRKDIENYVSAKKAVEAAVPTPPVGQDKAEAVTHILKEKKAEGMWEFGHDYPISSMRQVISRRMSESSVTAPHIHFYTEVDMTRVNDLKEEIADRYEKERGVRVSLNDIFIKLTALTIRDYPLLNARLDRDRIVVLPEINVCLAVAISDGLIVPSVRNADKRSLREIALMRKDLVDRARSGKLKLSELESGTFTISSLAQFDIFYFTAILNPPQSGILTIGKTQDKPVVVNGEIKIRPVTVLGLSVDHRLIDGAVAAAFLQSLKERLEKPVFYLIDSGF